MKNLIKKNKLLYNILLFALIFPKSLYFRFFLLIFRILKISKNKIMVVSYYGKGYGDNGKYIINELLGNNNLDIYWAVKKINDVSIPKEINKVKYNSIKYLYHLATSKIWINNTRFEYGTIKRKNQYYIQVWHGNFQLKKIEFETELSYAYNLQMKGDNKMIDLMVSNGKFCTSQFRSAFRYNGEIIEVGTPRNDVFINNKQDLDLKVRNYYKIDNNCKILLYCPTFRNSYINNPYDINFNVLKKILEDKYKCKWQIIIRLHPNIVNHNELIKTDVKYINASSYPDVQELICACDLLITDYSSIMFDAMISQKCVVLYANDINDYKKARGLNFEFSELPFYISKNNKELVELVKEHNLSTLMNKYLKFEEKLGIIENGSASKKVSQIIINKIR